MNGDTLMLALYGVAVLMLFILMSTGDGRNP